MDLWLHIPNQVGVDDLARATDLGFTHLVVPSCPELPDLAAYARHHHIQLYALVPEAWHPRLKEDYPHLAFRNHEGLSSFESKDPVVPPNNWPSFWNPEALDLIRDQFARAADLTEGSLAGFVTTIGVGDASVMPISWHQQPHGDHRSQEYWVFDEHALRAYDSLYPGELPAAHPEEDVQGKTFYFIQQGMLRRTEEVVRLAALQAPEVWMQVGPWCGNGYRDLAIGYGTSLHFAWCRWGHKFTQQTGVPVGWTVPWVYESQRPEHLRAVANIVHPNLGAAPCVAGGGTSGFAWREHLLWGLCTAYEQRLTGYWAEADQLLKPENENRAREILEPYSLLATRPHLVRLEQN
jgi:hypothetical protein